MAKSRSHRLCLSTLRHSPVPVEVQYSQIVAERRGQPFPFEGVLVYQILPLSFLQQHHFSAVVGSGSSRHHRQLALLGQTLPRVQREAWETRHKGRLAYIARGNQVLEYASLSRWSD